MRIDLNCDLGESFGAYQLGNDREVLQHVTSVNIACGFHAGDSMVMNKTVEMAKLAGVAIGAHPGFPDLQGFGRREMAVSPDEVYALVAYQIGALRAFTDIWEVPLQHVKPHGALYNMAAKDYELAVAIAKAVKDVDRRLILFGLAGSELVKAGKDVGLAAAEEVFADRTYQPNGTLTSRRHPDAMVHHQEEAMYRVTRMVKENKVRAVDGSDIAIHADTVCVHGDHPNALSFVKMLRSHLTQEGIRVAQIGEP